MNMPIQWTSADIIKLSMIEIHNFLKQSNYKSQLIMQVHDELVFDVFPWEEKQLWEQVTEIMENILQNQEIVLKTDTVFWDTWKEAK
jgi:DNA polymerase-1